MLNPMQKLLRLKQIDAAIESSPYTLPYKEHTALVEERAAILASVGQPPDALIGCRNPQLWAEGFVETFPGVADTDVHAWFQALYAAAAEEGREVGQREGMQQAGAGNRAMADALQNIRQLIVSKRIVNTRLSVDGACVTMDEYLQRTLQTAGALGYRLAT